MRRIVVVVGMLGLVAACKKKDDSRTLTILDVSARGGPAAGGSAAPARDALGVRAAPAVAAVPPPAGDVCAAMEKGIGRRLDLGLPAARALFAGAAARASSSLAEALRSLSARAINATSSADRQSLCTGLWTAAGREAPGDPMGALTAAFTGKAAKLPHVERPRASTSRTPVAEEEIADPEDR